MFRCHPIPRDRVRSVALAMALAAASLTAQVPAFAAPAEGECPTVSSEPGSESVEGEDAPQSPDAAPIRLEEGMVFDVADLVLLQRLIPKELWSHRVAFFFEGMRMELGPCHKRYAQNSFYAEATKQFAGKSELDGKGNLRGYTAGLPFPPEAIDAQAEDAALRWAWNLALRFRGAGPHGRFRITDLPNRIGRPLVFEGEAYTAITRGRADLAKSDYHTKHGDDYLWASGGRFSKPFDVRHLAWRQLRPLKTLRKWKQPDDVFVYVPTMRKSRRAAAAWTDGIYLPSYTAADVSGGGGIAFGDGVINPTAGQSIAVTENIRRGFEGLALRPNAYVWRLVGEQEVLAPLNGHTPGFPTDGERNFGPSGLSLASDRWDIRRAVIIEGAVREPTEAIRTVTYWIDRQTQQPLYRLTRMGRRRLAEVQVFVHRYSDNASDYPDWPGGVPASVFDPVAQSSYNVIGGGGGWRREGYGLRSTPYGPGELARLTSASALERGR